MWLIPYLAGCVLAVQPTWNLVFFAFGALLLFVARTEFVRWGRRGFPAEDLRRRSETTVALLLGTLGLLPLGIALYGIFTATAGLYVAFVFVLAASSIVLALLRLERTWTAELLGILLLTASGPIALAIGGTRDPGHLIAFHVINFLFFSLSIFYVRAKVGRLRERRDSLSLWLKARLGAVALGYLGGVHLALWFLVRSQLVPAGMFLAFLPITLHTLVGLARLDQRVDLRRLGFAEMVQSLVFLLSVLVLWTR